MEEKILIHHGILGQKWGVRRYQNDDGSLTEAGRARYEEKMIKKDMKWIKKNERKVYNKAYNASKKDMKKYTRELDKVYGRNKNGKVSAAYVNSFNRGLALLMNEKLGSVSAPSGRVVKFVAKRGDIGVYTALADPGYNMNSVKNGVWDSGRIAYKKTGVSKVNI